CSGPATTPARRTSRPGGTAAPSSIARCASRRPQRDGPLPPPRIASGCRQLGAVFCHTGRWPTNAPATEGSRENESVSEPAWTAKGPLLERPRNPSLVLRIANVGFQRLIAAPDSAACVA